MKQALVLLLIASSLLSCNRKSPEPASGTNVVLQPGTGALLVVFPMDQMIARNEWLAQVTLDGPNETRSLPRVPMGDLQSVLILHVVPGTYAVTASAWERKQAPKYGGSHSGIEIQPGKLTVVRAQALNGEPYPHSNTPLAFDRFESWSLARPDRFQEFIAETVKETTKG